MILGINDHYTIAGHEEFGKACRILSIRPTFSMEAIATWDAAAVPSAAGWGCSSQGGVNMYRDSRWNEKPLWANLRYFLNHFIMRKKHGWDVWDVLHYREMQRLIWLTRRRLKMEYDEYEQKHWTGVHG